MKPAKKVDFLEKVHKSALGLRRMQAVVIADKLRNDEIEVIDFASLGEQMLAEITGKDITSQYGLTEGIKLKEKLREERIKWIKNKKEENICIKLPITNQK